MTDPLESAACTPEPVPLAGFNPAAALPYGLTTDHIGKAMNEFVDFLGYVNQQLVTREIPRLETMLMPENFSSMVGEFMATGIPHSCPGLVKNRYHNGHPDLIPTGVYPGDSIRHAPEGIEVKASRYLRGWQGHNAENTWLMVFVFDSNRPVDADRGIAPRPFRFLLVAGARLALEDWRFSGRSDTSRRTITASVTRSGYEKMMANWIYRSPAVPTSAAAAPATGPPGPGPRRKGTPGT